MGRALQRRREARWGKEKGAARRKRTTRGGKHPGGVPSDPSYTVNAGRRVTRIPGSTHADRSRDFALENIGEKMVLSSGGRNIRDWITHAAAGKPDDPISMPAETTSVHRTLLITRIILARVEPHSLKISNRTVSSEVFRYSNESFSYVPERILSNALPDWSLKEEETRQGRIRRMNEGLLSIRSQFDSSAKSFAKNTSLCFRIRHRGTKQTNGGRLRLQKHDTGRVEQERIGFTRFAPLFFDSWKKLRKETILLLPSLSLPPVFPRTTREGNGGRIYSIRGFFPCTTPHGGNSSRRRSPQFPVPSEKKQREVSGSTSEVTRRVEVGWWLTLSLRASRRRRHLCATLPPPSPPFRPSATPSTHRPLRGCPFSRARRASHVLCTRAYRQTLSPSPPLCVLLPLLVSLWQRTCTWAESNTRLLTGCHPPFRRMPFDIFLGGSCARVEDDGIVAGWELWERWELEISSLLDFDVDVGFSESWGRVESLERVSFSLDA